MKRPHYPHDCRLYRYPCRCHRFLGFVNVRSELWDAWSMDYGHCILFRYGSEPDEYFSARVEDFQRVIQTFRNDERNRTAPAARDIMVAWQQVVKNGWWEK